MTMIALQQLQKKRIGGQKHLQAKVDFQLLKYAPQK
jgi:hypothetical protein